VPDMVEAGWGRIVAISSQSAQSGAPNMAHYSASKGGVIALTKSLAVDLARELEMLEPPRPLPKRRKASPRVLSVTSGSRSSTPASAAP
jgi:hypothetical protein